MGGKGGVGKGGESGGRGRRGGRERWSEKALRDEGSHCVIFFIGLSVGGGAWALV
jgi:hypothetical protein